MALRKPASLRRIEEKLQTIDPASLRHEVLEACCRFKNSWIELGQALFGVQRDKHFRDWGFNTFEDYCAKELGIRHSTATKLIRSYAFLEREEPDYIRKAREPEETDRRYPDLESVNLLRLAKLANRIDEEDYTKLRHNVLEEAREARDVRGMLKTMDRVARDRKDAPEIRQDNRNAFLMKVVRVLRDARQEASARHFLPLPVLRDMDALASALEEEAEK